MEQSKGKMHVSFAPVEPGDNEEKNKDKKDDKVRD